MIFIDYSEVEEKMFKAVRMYSKKLPPIGNDDYYNAFYNVIAQYGSGGEDYLNAEYLFSDLIEARTQLAFEKLNIEEQQDIREFYEEKFLDYSFYDEEQDEYVYSNEDLALYISDRFKVWVYDNYSTDDLLEDEDDYEEDEDEDEDEDEYEDENEDDGLIH